MAGNVAQLKEQLTPETLANQIYMMWNDFYNQRKPWVEEQKELRNYLFATDTSKTSNRTLPWRNSTTTPKLTQIRDNLHANYMAALFPNDQWLKWEGFSLDDATKAKREAIESYMQNKTRLGGFRTVISQLLYDYIDNGNAFADVEWINERKEDPLTGETIPGYVGPRVMRISPFDILINPVANNFKNTSKMVRKIMNLGELKAMAEDFPDENWVKEALIKATKFRHDIASGQYSMEDFDKASGYTIDGFGNLYEYYQSPYIELIEFEGDLYDPYTDTLLRNHIITVIDRTRIIRKEPMPSWQPKGNKAHVGWRLRPDNMYAMGPLHNLVGMQYRIDHLENIKADVFDLIAFPPLKIKGEIEEFDWAPGAEIHMDVDGDVSMLVPDTTALQADTQIAILEQRMEDYAGAPKQAMGIRTPGEKTAYEVQTLESAAGRIFQEKIQNFEVELLEPILNSMLEISRRNMDAADVVRVFDDDLGAQIFATVTKEHITANGKLRPVGARHFFSQQQLIQNLTGLFNSPVGQMIAPHVSSKQLAKLAEDLFGVERYQLISDNIALIESADQQRLMAVLQEQAVSEDVGMMGADQQNIDTNSQGMV
jgi:hypothetical protein